MTAKTYLLNFSIGNVVCRMTTLTKEYSKEHRSRYYNHKHSFFELHYVFSGRFLCKVDDQQYEVSAGQMILIQPGANHTIIPLTSDRSKMCLGFDVFADGLSRTTEEEKEFVELFYKEKVVVFDVDDMYFKDTFPGILNMLRATYDRDNLLMTEIEEIKSFMCLLLLGLHKELKLRVSIDDAYVPAERDMRNYCIDEFINLNFNRNDGYEILAKQLNISTRQLDRLLKKHYGMGYQRMLIERRLGIALDLLCDTDKPIDEISEIVGYSSASSFTAFVKRETGRTPSEIRKEKRQ